MYMYTLLFLLQLPGHKSASVVVHFLGKHVRNYEAVLLLVGELGVATRAQTLAFALQGSISGVIPVVRTHPVLYDISV